MRRMLAMFLSTIALAGAAHADEYDLDSDPAARAKKTKAGKDEVVREVDHGVYIKANVGATIYFGPRSPTLSPGTTLDITVGGDVFVREKVTVDVEGTVSQAIHGGTPWSVQPDLVAPQYYSQGDIYSVAAIVTAGVKFHPVRRLGLGLRAGGGIMFTPLLMDKTFYEQDVVVGAWGGQRAAIHENPHPVAQGGVILEYYTKLSHFSIGVEADFIYAVGVDYGVKVNGFFKYTF